MELNKIVDTVLAHFYSRSNTSGSYVLSKVLQDNGLTFDETNSKVICDKIKKLDFWDVIELASRHIYDLMLTPNDKGYEFYQRYQTYSEYVENKEKRENEVRQATLDSAKATVDAAMYARQSKNAAWFSGIFGAVAVVIAGYQLWKGNETDDKVDALTKRVVSIDSLTKAQLQSRTISEHANYRVLSDSLARPAVPLSGSPATGSAPPK